ncbi:apolipoprotein N-acyltransferase [Deinococcus cellulosilyticus]|uniref:Apolipoprotein N-acyltransferase n=1 Tax=Deinococcus cellulosilyticus (strain DSM 18568 / NBRC 106333 / KACC 11606 / 5516J-15) TaxID=1223518 RepID=A0A511N603_DEIC1|nr:apolipoprotein N-acyltransferase [Deinococcus cellulosilyticus]GEM48285.1 apolipoprotein N-acyltransferase [Deinococcus cellulosilyticus NBRC 106333 = KACC 11606]
MFLLPFIFLALSSLNIIWGFLTPLFLAWVFKVLIDTQTRRAALRRMFWGMSLFFAIFLYWLPISFYGQYGIFGAVIFIPLWFIEGAFWMLMAAVVFNLSRDRYTRLWLLAFGWVLLEWLRHLGMFAFPWGTLGYTLLGTPLIQAADLGGVMLLSLLTTVTAAALVSVLEGQFIPVALTAALWVGGWFYGITRDAPTGTPQQATLVQGNIDPRLKAQDVNHQMRSIDIYNNLSQGTGLFIWPETAIYDHNLEEAQPAQLITGMSDQTTIHNRVVAREVDVASNQTRVTTHDKIRLVPFGEWYPMREQLASVYEPIEKQLGVYLGSWRVGEKAEPLEMEGQKLGTYVCYESVFGWIARRMVLNGADVLVNVSNDAWFGTGAGLRQHYDMGRVRAIETHRYILRAGNTGVTAVIDPLGRTLERLPLWEEGTLKANYQSLTGATIYMLVGDWLVIGICLFGSIWVLFTGSRKARVLL